EAGHVVAVLGDQIVLAGAEEVLAIVPGGAEEGDSAGQRLEHADGGDAGEEAGVIAAGDVDCGEVAGEDAGGLGIGEPAMVKTAIAADGGLGGLVVADAVDVEAEAGGAGGAGEIFLQRLGPLALGP